MSDRLLKLQKLADDLHAADEELSQAGRPAQRIDDLNLEQREKAFNRWREAFVRWELVAQQIDRTLKEAEGK